MLLEAFVILFPVFALVGLLTWRVVHGLIDGTPTPRTSFLRAMLWAWEIRRIEDEGQREAEIEAFHHYEKSRTWMVR